MPEQKHAQKPTLVLTDAARAVLERVKSSRPGRLALVIGNGCCDSTAPYLFADYAAGPNERAIGEIAGVPVYLDESIVQTFESTEVVVDVRRGAADSFSCESELGWRFVLDRLPALHP